MQTLNIIIPFFNSSATLGRTIDSLSCIGVKNRSTVTVWGVDDGSNDESSEIFLNQIKHISGINFKLLKKINGGSSSARNLALEMFNSGWVQFLDSDDELVSDPVEYIEKNKNKSALIFSVSYFRNGKLIFRKKPLTFNPKKHREVFSSGNPYASLSTIFQRSLIQKFFIEDLEYIEDYAFWALNQEIFKKSIALSDVQIGRIHTGPKNKSSDQFNNGKCRLQLSKILEREWSDELSRKVTNNLFVQDAIGKIQMGKPRIWAALAMFPVSFTLYLKLLIYTFCYGIYKKYYPYSS